MTLPTIITSYYLNQNASNTTTLTTSSFTPANGEIIVILLGTWSTSIAMGAPTDNLGTHQTYTSRKIAAPGGSFTWSGIYTATITGSPTNMTISSTPGSACWHAMVVYRLSGAALATTPATNSTINGSTAAPSATITTTGTDSLIFWVNGDWNARDPTAATYRSSAVGDYVQNGSASADVVTYFAHQTAATAGSQTIGQLLPATQNWCMAGIEVQSSAGTTYNVDVSKTLTETVTVTAATTANADVSETITQTVTALAGKVQLPDITKTITQAATVTANATMGVTEAETFTQALTVSGAVTANANELDNIVQVVTPTVTMVGDVDESQTITQDITVSAVPTRYANEAQSITQAVTVSASAGSGIMVDDAITQTLSPNVQLTAGINTDVELIQAITVDAYIMESSAGDPTTSINVDQYCDLYPLGA